MNADLPKLTIRTVWLSTITSRRAREGPPKLPGQSFASEGARAAPRRLLLASLDSQRKTYLSNNTTILFAPTVFHWD
ncbi:hypothetical protein CpipJ_CPIJ017311 [Culex quinquefasciatus]|uniref:Uncharacterized protein n=1 Tax=Culex quinquefasciatus TaxID=7176 RepID=B0XCQ9_CULQU|nr:hypothetical protein CpipJ_CPIJ017311 [Culex quinquefasciatus]|eukprot:XP_001867431.1 hypothetical protein CpipJ_CPIJ017311 [Culex quinquefasciatus]